MTQPVNQQRRGIIKFSVWTLVAATVMTWTIRSYLSGQMSEWFYHRAAVAGYAVNADTFKTATKAAPALLQVTTGDVLSGLAAIRVEKGARLPRNTNGVISDEVIAKGKRAVRDGANVRVLEPWVVKESKGFKFKDTFKHKGIETWPWVGVWNVLIVALLGVSLGLMAEGFTDMFGLRLEKIRHNEKVRGAHV